jgi:hypothetical protein
LLLVSYKLGLVGKFVSENVLNTLLYANVVHAERAELIGRDMAYVLRCRTCLISGLVVSGEFGWNIELILAHGCAAFLAGFRFYLAG